MNGILFHTSIYSYILFSNLHGLWQIYSIITRAMLPMTMGNLKITVFYLSIYIFFTLWALFWKNVALCMKNLGTFVFKITKPFFRHFLAICPMPQHYNGTCQTEVLFLFFVVVVVVVFVLLLLFLLTIWHLQAIRECRRYLLFFLWGFLN